MTPSIQLHTMQSDILRRIAASHIVTSYLEVGVQEGKSLVTVLDASARIKRVALFDDWGTDSGGSGRGSHQHIVKLLVNYPDVVAAFYDGDSRLTLPGVVGQKYDLVHIDGGHSYDVASSDLLHGWKLTKHYMVVHDTCMLEVWRALFDFIRATSDIEALHLYFGGHGTAVLHKDVP